MNQYNAAGEAKTSVFVENVKFDCSQISVERATGKLKRSGCMDTTNSRSLAGELAKANWKSLKRSNTEVKAKVGYRISEAVTNPTLVCKHFPRLPLDDHSDGILRRDTTRGYVSHVYVLDLIQSLGKKGSLSFAPVEHAKN